MTLRAVAIDLQFVADSLCRVLHEAVFRTASALARSPTGTQHIGRLAVNAVGWVDPELVTYPFVHPSRAHVGVKIGDLRGNFLAEYEV